MKTAQLCKHDLFPCHCLSSSPIYLHRCNMMSKLVFSPAVWTLCISTRPSSLLPLTWWAETALCSDESWDPLGWICSDDGVIPRLSSFARPYDWISRHGWRAVCVCARVCSCVSPSVCLCDLKGNTLTLVSPLLYLLPFWCLTVFSFIHKFSER